MATAKPRRAARAETRGARTAPATRSPKPATRASSARRRETPRAAGASASSAPAQKVTAHKSVASFRPQSERRRGEPQTLRLRSLEPSFTVDDLEKSLRFYTEVLGFIVGERWSDGGALKGVMLKAGVCELGLSQDDWAKGRNRNKGVGLRIWCQTGQDVDVLATRIKKAGGRIEGPREESWGARTLSVTDPDGFQLTFYQGRDEQEG
jgi:catechol 2,3-dioxygenase-like lactoylglutathione lyase family enzyme